jgi:hypothetical protein
MSGKSQNAMAIVATLVASAVARKVVDATWKAGSRGKEPPTDPADPDFTLNEALLFAALSGAAIGVVRVLIARRLARGERRATRVQRAISP